MPEINHKQVDIALTQVSTGDFENFVNSFLAPILGPDFIPTGGVHDGGADAFMNAGVYATQTPGTFFQASIQSNHKAKISRTVRRLRKVGRDPKRLVYVTTRSIRMIDQDEFTLTQNTGVFVRIRDARWITSHINHSRATISAFETYLRPHLSFLGKIGGATLIESPRNVDTRTLCVFLRQETERRSNNSKLIESVSDSLILWALEGTDPDTEVFATRAEIMAKIEKVLPSARQFIRGVFQHRLETLSSKGNATGREIRWYKKQDKFCLPYETRLVVEAENTEDEHLKTQVLQEFETRAQSLSEDIDSRSMARIALRSIELTFEEQGLELAALLEEDVGELSDLSIADRVDKAIDETTLEGEPAVIAKEVALSLIRRAIYESTGAERAYFAKLSRTYSLLFYLRAEPRIVEYFQSMSASLVLLVGTDILIRALSERYLRPEDQMTCNMLSILKHAGADLVLAEPVVEEVHTHVRNTDLEFQLDFMEIEPYVDLDIARHASKILIRAYFYARLRPVEGVSRPTGWKAFIGQVCEHENLRSNVGRDQIRKYLIERFGMRYVSTEDLEELVSEDSVSELADTLEELRPDKRREIAENDAKMVFSVYGKRQALREHHQNNPYGFRTWWLTQETAVRRATRELVRNKGAHYMMRPEFLLNFIALSPSTQEVRRAYADIFPSLLGVRLANRMRPGLFHGIMRRAKDAMAFDDARTRVMMEEYSNRLKGDFYKQYEVDLESEEGLYPSSKMESGSQF